MWPEAESHEAESHEAESRVAEAREAPSREASSRDARRSATARSAPGAHREPREGQGIAAGVSGGPSVEEDARLAAALVALGFPGDHARYVEDRPPCLERWRTDRGFRALATAIARGLGLVLVDVTPEGEVVLVAEAGTPFTPLTSTLLPGNVAPEEHRRQASVIALMGVIAEVFPTEDALAGVDEAREVLAADVVQLLLHRSEELAREPAPTDGAAAADARDAARDGDLRRAFEVVRGIQPSVPTKSGRQGALGLEGIVTHVLRTLTDHGLLRESRAGERITFRPTSRFAPHVRHLVEREALADALDGLRDARAAAGKE